MVDGSSAPLYIALQHNNDGATKMTSKATPTVKKVRTAAAPKTAPVAKPVAKVAAAPAEKPAQLVTNIVTVEPTPAKPIIAQGIVKMTEETKATAETVTAKAKDFFADMQVKATEAAEKGKKLAADATEFSKANAEAVIEAAKIAAKGAQEMGCCKRNHCR
jgi:hypothetical protein